MAISEFTHQQIHRGFPGQAKDKPVEVIGEDVEPIALENCRMHEILEKDLNYLFSLGVGRKQKNLPLLIECYSRYVDTYGYGGTLYIAGPISEPIKAATRAGGGSKGGLHQLNPDRCTGVSGSNPGPVGGALALIDVLLRRARLIVEGCVHIEEWCRRRQRLRIRTTQAGMAAQDHHG